MGKRGQVALFVLIAVAIIAIFVWLVVYPRVQVSVSDVDPSQYIKNCIGPEVKNVLPTIMKQGGSYTPTNYLLEKDVKVQYLCYISENYKPCIVQQPLLVRHVESEIRARVEPKARACMQDLIDSYKSKGYSVESTRGDINVSIIPGSINVEFIAPFKATKGATQTFRRFNSKVSSEAYDLLMIATSLVEFESTYGDSETSLYMQYYPDLNIEKLKKNDDTIYTLTNVVTKDKFTFATRSLIWPQGYAVTK